MNQTWPFDQAENVAAITSRQVLAGAMITHVYHMEDDHSWAFLHASGINDEDGKVIGMKTAIGLDDSLVQIADLEPGWMAWRLSKGLPWKRKQVSGT